MRADALVSSLSALFAPAVLADFTLRTWEVLDGQLDVQRIWYGDGATYVGSTIPPEVKTAFNFTVDGDRRDLLFVKVDKESSHQSTADLPNPTFLVANVADGARDAFSFAHSAVGFTHESIYLYSSIDGLWYPRTRDNVPPGGTYLVPTSVDGTYSVRWIVDSTDVAALGARPVTLASRGGIR